MQAAWLWAVAIGLSPDAPTAAPAPIPRVLSQERCRLRHAERHARLGCAAGAGWRRCMRQLRQRVCTHAAPRRRARSCGRSHHRPAAHAPTAAVGTNSRLWALPAPGGCGALPCVGPPLAPRQPGTAGARGGACGGVGCDRMRADCAAALPWRRGSCVATTSHSVSSGAAVMLAVREYLHRIFASCLLTGLPLFAGIVSITQ